LIFALVVYVAIMALNGLAGKPVLWGRYPVFLPTGLLFLGLVKHLLRSKVLARGLFSLSFVFLILVLGALVAWTTTIAGREGAGFLLMLALYGATGMAGLYQLRARTAMPPAAGGRG